MDEPLQGNPDPSVSTAHRRGLRRQGPKPGNETPLRARRRSGSLRAGAALASRPREPRRPHFGLGLDHGCSVGPAEGQVDCRKGGRCRVSRRLQTRPRSWNDGTHLPRRSGLRAHDLRPPRRRRAAARPHQPGARRPGGWPRKRCLSRASIARRFFLWLAISSGAELEGSCSKLLGSQQIKANAT